MSLDMPPWAPTVKQVAKRMLARTQIPGGTLAGTFTAETSPTEEQAIEAIEDAVAYLRPRFGPVPDALADMAAIVCALRTATELERSLFPEQSEMHGSPFMSLQKDFEKALYDWDCAAKGMAPNSPSKIHSMKIGTEYPGYATGTF